MNAFDPVRAVRVLDGHGVRFVAVGSFAKWLHGSTHLTAALEVRTDDSVENRAALSAALADLNASELSREPLVYDTNAGALAIAFGGDDYAALVRTATRFELADDVRVSAASGEA